MSVRLHGASGRSYDPEGQRQRRLGAGMAAAGGGGAAALVSGGRELHRLNSRTKAVMRDAGAASESIRHTAVVSRRSAGKVAGGLVGLATANKIRHHANDPSNRKWD